MFTLFYFILNGSFYVPPCDRELIIFAVFCDVVVEGGASLYFNL